MAIQVRRGNRVDFDPEKMLPGEWAVSTDAEPENQMVWMCFAPGVVKRIGTYEDLAAKVEEISQQIQNDYGDRIKKAEEATAKNAEQITENSAAISRAVTAEGGKVAVCIAEDGGLDLKIRDTEGD